MNIGDECIYQLRDGTPIERVRIVGVDERKKTPRYEVSFLDHANPSKVENVPRNRLHGSWSDAQEFRRVQDGWAAISRYELTEAEDYAASHVFDVLVPTEIATLTWRPVSCAVSISDIEALDRMTGHSTQSIANAVTHFELDDELILSPAAAVTIAEHVCRKNPTPILDWLRDEEKSAREACKHGKPYPRRDDPNHRSSPEWEYQYYLEHTRPVHELLRQWAGHRAIGFYDRLAAAEAEVHRLDKLVGRLIDSLKQNEIVHFAAAMEEEYEKNRITPFNVRPDIDRPLDLSEIPVRYVERRRGHWWN